MGKVRWEFETQELVLRERKEAVYLCGMMKRLCFESEKEEWPSLMELKKLQKEFSVEELADLWLAESRNWFHNNPIPGKFQPRLKPKTAVRFIREKIEGEREKVLWPGGNINDV